MTHQGEARDAASAHFGPTIRKTDIFVITRVLMILIYAGY